MLRKAQVVRGVEATPIGARAPSPGYARVVRREVLEAHDEAAMLLERAREEVERLLKDADERVSSIQREAEATGHAAGLARAVADAARIAKREDDLDHQALGRSIEIARLLAERIVGHAIAVEPETLEQMARTTAREVRGARQLRFLVHPDDVERIEHALREVATTMPVTVEGNAALKRGDFELHTDAGTLNASLGARLELLTKSLAEHLR